MPGQTHRGGADRVNPAPTACVNVKTHKWRYLMRLVLCIVILALLPASALAAKGGGSMSLSQAQAAAAKGDQKASAAVATTTDRQTCMNECANRGHSKGECT